MGIDPKLLEDYLKAIYALEEQGERPTTSRLAELMRVTPASVTDVMKRMAQAQYVEYVRYQGVKLTEAGRRRALQVVRRHRLWELFLAEVLGFSWDQVHEIADQLEHVESPLLEERLDAFLGHPKIDPHGHPIPDAHGRIERIEAVALASLPVGQSARVLGASDSHPDFLRYLAKIGLKPGARLEVVERFAFDGSMQVRLGEEERLLSAYAAQNVLVVPLGLGPF
ncbi:MAG: metal-dependent transcriptional regulator [Bacteroidota bacterium]|nr:metal-dependent transcriptional regulator [Bacteroidota bacterium]MDW8137227.1 metal-dependent transcriptional regulator [Bacteroidota bacterium]